MQLQRPRTEQCAAALCINEILQRHELPWHGHPHLPCKSPLCHLLRGHDAPCRCCSHHAARLMPPTGSLITGHTPLVPEGLRAPCPVQRAWQTKRTLRCMPCAVHVMCGRPCMCMAGGNLQGAGVFRAGADHCRASQATCDWCACHKLRKATKYLLATTAC